MTDLAGHRAYLAEAIAAAQTAPLSRRKALLAAMLIDAHVDRVFAAGGAGDDILDYRAAVAGRSAPLGLLLRLCGQQGDLELVTEAVAVPIEDYGSLSVEDFMVSLYNDHSVQRLMLVGLDGQPELAHPVLMAAIQRLAEVQATLTGDIS